MFAVNIYQSSDHSECTELKFVCVLAQHCLLQMVSRHTHVRNAEQKRDQGDGKPSISVNSISINGIKTILFKTDGLILYETLGLAYRPKMLKNSWQMFSIRL